MTNDIEQIAYTNVTDDDWVMAKRDFIHPEHVYSPGSQFHTFISEDHFGIGAHDGDVIDMTNVTEWTPDEEAPWYEAGALYAMARRGANRMRGVTAGRIAFVQRMGL